MVREQTAAAARLDAVPHETIDRMKLRPGRAHPVGRGGFWRESWKLASARTDRYVAASIVLVLLHKIGLGVAGRVVARDAEEPLSTARIDVVVEVGWFRAALDEVLWLAARLTREFGWAIGRGKGLTDRRRQRGDSVADRGSRICLVAV